MQLIVPLPWTGDSERGGVPTTGDSGSYGGGGGEDGDGVGECGCLESRSGSRSRILRTVWEFARTQDSNKSTGQSVCVDASNILLGGSQHIASGGWDELLAKTPLPRLAGVGKFGLLWGEHANICRACMAFLTYFYSFIFFFFCEIPSVNNFLFLFFNFHERWNSLLFLYLATQRGYVLMQRGKLGVQPFHGSTDVLFHRFLGDHLSRPPPH